MVRLQVQLEAAQHRAVRRRARHLGVSVSEVIRRCVDAELRQAERDDPAERARRALAVAGRYADAEGGDARTAVDHDAVLTRSYRS